MRTLKCLCIVSALIINLLCSCSLYNVADKDMANKADGKNVKGLDTLGDNSDIGKASNNTSDAFESEMKGVFYSIIQNNPIDSDYNSERIDSTTLDLRKHENKYAKIWLSEMEYSCESMCKLLKEYDKARFMQLQKDWLERLNDEFDLINNIFLSEDYQLLVGSTFSIEMDSEYLQVIRNRTLYIKYIEFAIKYNSETQYDSLVDFQYE